MKFNSLKTMAREGAMAVLGQNCVAGQTMFAQMQNARMTWGEIRDSYRDIINNPQRCARAIEALEVLEFLED